MGKLFGQADFDSFCLNEAEIMMAAGYKINGHRNRNFYTEEEWENVKNQPFLSWQENKALIFQMIRGNKTPLGMVVVLSCPNNLVTEILTASGTTMAESDVTGLYLNFKFIAGELLVVTATGLSAFTLDKSLENYWDNWVKRFLTEHDIDFEEK